MGWSIDFHPEVHMFVWRRRDGRASVKTGEMENRNESLTTGFRILELVERLIFMAESAHFGFMAMLSG